MSTELGAGLPPSHTPSPGYHGLPTVAEPHHHGEHVSTLFIFALVATALLVPRSYVVDATSPAQLRMFLTGGAALARPPT
jgi:hypothetical protein